jgi:hypothetical protein
LPGELLQEIGQIVFIVQAKPREPEGIMKVTKASREDALQAANNFLNQGMPFVTIVADGRVADDYQMKADELEDDAISAKSPDRDD